MTPILTRTGLLAALLMPGLAAAAGLNDTGITQCADAYENNLTCPQDGFPLQDAETGRDAQASLSKAGGGSSRFDFTKLDANGDPLPADAPSWDCVRDNVTGLIWEIKTDNDPPDQRDKDWIYTWCNNITSANGGNPGLCDPAPSGSDTCFDPARCDTEKYIEDVKNLSLCGYDDWRMPTLGELHTIAISDNPAYIPAIDATYFPETQSSSYSHSPRYWSASTLAPFPGLAWYMDFGFGSNYTTGKGSFISLRLVRGKQAILDSTPTDDFVLDDVYGTAYQKKTGLTWKRCAEGQSWTGNTCTGVAKTYTWPDTFSLVADNWRLPNIKELASIVERRNSNPAINTTVFPNTPIAHFWSASPSGIQHPSDSFALRMFFRYGEEDRMSKAYGHAVRLVRGGQQYSLLSVAKAGGGSGTVTSNLPGIDCGKFCQGSFANEMFTAVEGRIILMATADDGSDFAGWEGCIALEGSPNECVLDSAADTSVTANFNLEVTVITVAIDIKPGSFTNSINPRSRGVIPVAILTTDTFDATTVDALSVEFGPARATESHGRGHIEDVDGDGNMDLVLHFRTQDTGIQCGETSASLTGNTYDGAAIQGSDSIRTVGCK